MRDSGVWPWPWWIDAALLAAIAGGLAWAVIADDRDTSAYLAVAGLVPVFGLASPRSTPDTPAWVLALTAAGCAAAAVGFFGLYQWAGWPAMGYVAATGLGLTVFAAILSLWVRSSGGPSRPGRPPAGGVVAPDTAPGAAPDTGRT
jgi:hypothetical protein